MIKSYFEYFRYKCWFFCGGSRTEKYFAFLSKSVLENRKLIHELRSDFRNLESRVWEIEGHSPEETLEKIKKQLEAFEIDLSDLKSDFN